MKRILIAVLIVALLICLIAWHDGPDDGEYYDYSGLRTQHPIYAYNIDDYALFLERCSPMPKWFITYDEISSLGEFVSFAFEPEKWYYWNDNREDLFEKQGSHDAIAARYTIEDEEGYEYVFAYYHWYLDDEPKEAYEGIRSNVSENGAKSITWMYKGTEFIFFGLEDYPENAEDTFVSRLLNPETVDAAVAEFNLRVKGY